MPTLPTRVQVLLILLTVFIGIGASGRSDNQQSITGEIFLVKNSGDAVRLADVEIFWFSKKDLQSFREAGTQIGRELKDQNTKRQSALPRVKQMSIELLPRIREEIRSEQEKQSQLKKIISDLQTRDREALSKIEAIKSQQQEIRKKQSQKIDSEINTLLSERAVLLKPLNELDLQYGQQVVALFTQLSKSKNIGYEEFAHTNDPQTILRYIANADANTGKYDQLLKKAYSYSARGLYFPGIYSKITAFSVEREKLHALLDPYVDTRNARVVGINRKQASIDEVIAAKTREMRMLDTAAISLPEELMTPAAELQAQIELMAKSLVQSKRLDIVESTILKGFDFSNLPWPDDQAVEANYLLALLNESSGSAREKAISQGTQKAYSRWVLYNADRIRTDSLGAFELPADAAAVIAFYENQHMAAGRTFSWYQPVSSNVKITLSQSNCIEGVAGSLDVLVSVALKTIISNAVDEALR